MGFSPPRIVCVYRYMFKYTSVYYTFTNYMSIYMRVRIIGAGIIRIRISTYVPYIMCACFIPKDPPSNVVGMLVG